MRRAFIEELTALAVADPRILLLSMDLGYTVVEPFRDRLPARFWNTGVCEQSALGMAAGLAEAGFLPFVYSIATFATARPFEFIRNGAAVQRLPVRIVGVGGGFEYGTAGPTHHAGDDIGLMRMLPGMGIATPADHLQARACLRATWDAPGPVYYRVGKDETYEVPGLDGRFAAGECQTVREGDDVCLVALGTMAREALAAAEALARDGIRAAVVVVSSVAPAPRASLEPWLGRVPLMVTVEQHVAAGGIGEAIGAWVAERGSGCRLVRCCIDRAWDGVVGSEAFLVERHGLSASALVRQVRDGLKGRAR